MSEEIFGDKPAHQVSVSEGSGNAGSSRSRSGKFKADTSRRINVDSTEGELVSRHISSDDETSLAMGLGRSDPGPGVLLPENGPSGACIPRLTLIGRGRSSGARACPTVHYPSAKAWQKKTAKACQAMKTWQRNGSVSQRKRPPTTYKICLKRPPLPPMWRFCPRTWVRKTG